jgi:HSP20 family protein
MGALDETSSSLFMSSDSGLKQAPWRPQADVYRTHQGWAVKFNLAGVRPEDVELKCKGTKLTIKGARSDCLMERVLTQYQLEIEYSRFERTLQIPCNVERARVTREFQHGMLVIFLNTEE